MQGIYQDTAHTATASIHFCRAEVAQAQRGRRAGWAGGRGAQLATLTCCTDAQPQMQHNASEQMKTVEATIRVSRWDGSHSSYTSERTTYMRGWGAAPVTAPAACPPAIRFPCQGPDPSAHWWAQSAKAASGRPPDAAPGQGQCAPYGCVRVTSKYVLQAPQH